MFGLRKTAAISSAIAIIGFVSLLAIAQKPTETQTKNQESEAAPSAGGNPGKEVPVASVSESPAMQSSARTRSSNYRLQKIGEWRSAVANHTPGKADASALAMASWHPADLESVIDFLTGRSVQKSLSSASVRRLLQLTDQEVKKKDLSRILKLGALLHTDVDLLELETGFFQQTSAGIQGIAMFADGRVILQPQKLHWQLARRLIETLPAEDLILQKWYIATIAYMESRRLLAYAGQNLKSALDKLPSDYRILFYAGALHETWAAPVNQNHMLPRGGRVSFGSRESELRLAQQFFRRALVINPLLAEAHLRLGRVTGLLGNHKEAVSELQSAAAAIKDEQLLYYASLYLGFELEMLARPDDAREQYKRAAKLFPGAQSPLLALSQLSLNSGNSSSALAEIQRVFELRVQDHWNDDPWWSYDVAHVRDAAALIQEMLTAFGGLR